MRFALLTLLLASTLAAATPETQALLARFQTVQGIANRAQALSAYFLGKPYGFDGPLGEGPGARYDQDPLFRFDTFDCTTFVETVLALAHAQDEQDFEERLRQIRYEHGNIDFTTRNHFTSLDWVPNNIANGYLRDITRELAPAGVARVASAVIDKPGWYNTLTADMLRVAGLSPAERSARVDEWHREGDRFTPVVSDIDYVPIDWIVQNPAWLQRLPNGAIVNFIRPNWDLTATAGTHENVSHQGWIIRSGNRVLLRHASPSGDKVVTEIAFLDYLRKWVGHATLKGVHFLAIE